MRRQFVIIAILVLLILTKIGISSISAQKDTPIPSIPSSLSAPDVTEKISEMENRVLRLEVVQTQLIESLKASNDQNKSLLTAFGAFIGLLVAIQGLATFAQLRREGRRDDLQANRDAERNRIEQAGAKQVSDIMHVVKDTLESRLNAEKKARSEAEDGRKKLEEFSDKILLVNQFVSNFQTNIQKARRTIEDTASQWAKEISRHGFRRMTSELSGFARQFDIFMTDYEALEKEPHPQFSARVFYIRGIAAHYANQPEIAKKYLSQVVEFQQPEPGEIEIAYDRRVANAYYYLGVNESNFGNNDDAIAYFERANKLDPTEKDFLTRIVTAEIYAMSNNIEVAERYLSGVESGAQALESQGLLRSEHQRLRTRSALIRTNMVIRSRGDAWIEEATRYLQPAQLADPAYYYATATLAQIRTASGDLVGAKSLFREAYDSIERSGDLQTVMEVRSQILLRMVAGLCCKHGLMNEVKSEEHLDKADRLRDSLPKVGSQVCTVFSTLSKRNEKSEIIHHHIELIRKGQNLLESGPSAH